MTTHHTTIDVNDVPPIELIIHTRGVTRFRWRLRLVGWLLKLADRIAPGNVNLVELRREEIEVQEPRE